MLSTILIITPPESVFVSPQVVVTIMLWNMSRGNLSLIRPGSSSILINVGDNIDNKEKYTQQNLLAINTENKPSTLTNSWFLLRFRSRELTLTQNVTKVKWHGLRASKSFNVDQRSTIVLFTSNKNIIVHHQNEVKADSVKVYVRTGSLFCMLEV